MGLCHTHWCPEKKKEKEQDKQYKLKEAMAITIGLIEYI